jgi:hypothetical protein
MAQATYTPIQLYFSTTAAAIPTAGNLANGELAINITDGKLYYKDNGGTVRLLASNATSAPVLSFQTSLGGLTPSTATTGVVTLAGTLNTSSGGTGLTTFTAGDITYYAAGTLLSKLGIGTTNQVLTSSGTAPQWSSAITVTGVTDSGNLTFTGTGNRITGDFSNATIANRVEFQGSTVNGNTIVGAIPNGTGTGAGFDFFNNSDTTNASRGRINASASAISLEATITGTGTYLPIYFATGGATKVVIVGGTGSDVGYVGVGTTTPSALLYVQSADTNALVINEVLRNPTTVSGIAAIGFNVCSIGEGDYTQAGIGLLRSIANGSGSLCFYNKGSGTASNFTTADEKMRIDTSGNLGIGTVSPTSGLQTAGSSAKSAFKTPNIAEVNTISATAATGTINYDITTQSVLYYTTNASGNFTVNFRGSSGTTLNTVMQTGESISATFLVTNGATAYYNSVVQVDGSTVTPKWQGGTAPTSGNASSIDSYTYVIIKTGSAAFTVLASVTKFA